MTILGAVSVKQFLYDDLAELVLPSSVLLEANADEVELPSDPRFQIARQMEGFVKRFAQVCWYEHVNDKLLIIAAFCGFRAERLFESMSSSSHHLPYCSGLG